MGKIINLFTDPAEELKNHNEDIDMQIKEECELMFNYMENKKQTPFEKKRSEKLIEEFLNDLDKFSK